MNLATLLFDRPRPSLPAPSRSDNGHGDPFRDDPRHCAPRRTVEIARTTGPLEVLRGRRVLALFDVENLMLGARDLGRRVRFDLLVRILGGTTRGCARHAFFSHAPGDRRLEEHLAGLEFRTHGREIRQVRTHGELRTSANSDGRLLITAGKLISRSPADVVLVASGDGELVDEIAEFVAGEPRGRRVATLSLAGSTSYRLQAGSNPRIAANLELGLDALSR